MLKFQFSQFQNPKNSFVRTIEKIIQQKFVEEVVFLENRIFGNIVSAPNDPKITLTDTRQKLSCICWTINHDSEISLRFALRSLAFQIFEVFDFSIGYNGEAEIFEKDSLKIRKSKFQKYPMQFCEDQCEENSAPVSFPLGSMLTKTNKIR